MRLNGWQRIGVVLSVVWLLCVFGYWAVHRLDAAQQSLSFQIQECSRAEDYPPARSEDAWKQFQPENFASCQARVNATYVADFHQANGTWPLPLAFWGVTVTMAWLLTWGLFGLGRWIRRGFAE